MKCAVRDDSGWVSDKYSLEVLFLYVSTLMLSEMLNSSHEIEVDISED